VRVAVGARVFQEAFDRDVLARKRPLGGGGGDEERHEQERDGGGAHPALDEGRRPSNCKKIAFNRSGNGEGGNAEASRFTTGKTKNPYAYLAAFTADGEYLGEWAAEEAVRAAAERDPLPAAPLAEELGAYDEAVRLYEKAGGAESVRACARIARYARDWERHEALERPLADPADRAAERAYRLLARGKFALGRVLKATGERPEAALQALREAVASRDPYVAALARSGMKLTQ
jgi:hypothetical protein